MAQQHLIQLRYCFKEFPKTTLSVYLKDMKEVEKYKQEHPNYMFLETLQNV